MIFEFLHKDKTLISSCNFVYLIEIIWNKSHLQYSSDEGIEFWKLIWAGYKNWILVSCTSNLVKPPLARQCILRQYPANQSFWLLKSGNACSINTTPLTEKKHTDFPCRINQRNTLEAKTKVNIFPIVKRVLNWSSFCGLKFCNSNKMYIIHYSIQLSVKSSSVLQMIKFPKLTFANLIENVAVPSLITTWQ